jgi:hypothetical protein
MGILSSNKFLMKLHQRSCTIHISFRGIPANLPSVYCNYTSFAMRARCSPQVRIFLDSNKIPDHCSECREETAGGKALRIFKAANSTIARAAGEFLIACTRTNACICPSA